VALLQVRNLTKQFGGLRAVSDVAFDVQDAEILGLIGPNGAGKTTTFNLIAGTLPPTEGDVFFRGERITGLRPHQIAHKGIIRTFQTIRLFKELSVADNIYAGGVSFFKSGLTAGVCATRLARGEQAELRRRVDDIMKYLGIEFAAAMPAGALPYGHQRRVEMARALAANPVLLMLDEPSAGMNPIETGEIMELVRRIRGAGTTVLLIEHDMHMVMGVCDRVTVLQSGQKIAEGTPQEIQRNPVVVEAYLGSGHSYA